MGENPLKKQSNYYHIVNYNKFKTMKTNVIIEWHSNSKEFNKKMFKIYTCQKIGQAEKLIEEITNKFVQERKAKKLNNNKRCSIVRVRNFEITIYTIKPKNLIIAL